MAQLWESHFKSLEICKDVMQHPALKPTQCISDMTLSTKIHPGGV
jgi:hypothetical protein